MMHSAHCSSDFLDLDHFLMRTASGLIVAGDDWIAAPANILSSLVSGD